MYTRKFIVDNGHSTITVLGQNCGTAARAAQHFKGFDDVRKFVVLPDDRDDADKGIAYYLEVNDDYVITDADDLNEMDWYVRDGIGFVEVKAGKIQEEDLLETFRTNSAVVVLSPGFPLAIDYDGEKYRFFFDDVPYELRVGQHVYERSQVVSRVNEILQHQHQE